MLPSLPSALAAGLSALLLALSCCPLVRVLSVRGEGMSVLLSREAVREGFVISYTHSVNKGRVHDFYACEGNALVLEKTVFASYGAGMPEAEETPGSGFSVTDSGYELVGLDRRTDELCLAVGLTARHSIALRQAGADGGEDMGEELYLQDVFAVQTPVRIRVRHVSLLRCLLARKLMPFTHP
jgi:hypothetical protein